MNQKSTLVAPPRRATAARGHPAALRQAPPQPCGTEGLGVWLRRGLFGGIRSLLCVCIYVCVCVLLFFLWGGSDKVVHFPPPQSRFVFWGDLGSTGVPCLILDLHVRLAEGLGPFETSHDSQDQLRLAQYLPAFRR